MNFVEIELETWNRFKTNGFWAKPELLGKFHEFSFNQYQIRIELPSEKDIPVGNVDGDKLSFAGYREINGNKIPVQLWVHTVDISVSIPNKIRFPDKILKQRIDARKIFSENQQNSLNVQAYKYNEIAKQAFDLWLRTLRWKCLSSGIGRPDIDNFETGWTTYLVDKQTKERVWAATQILTLKGATLVTVEHWNDASEALKKDLRPPVYFDLMFDAEEHLKNGDLQRAVIDLAIACEAYLRITVLENLPQNLAPSFKNYINLANISQFINNFFSESLENQNQEKYTKKLIKDLNKLFDARNIIMHSGRMMDLSLNDCKSFLKTTQKLLSMLENTE